ncbi:MAG: hypothetical protein COB63_04495 [Candidatus Pelagibacter sp.]|nr:MAG: hypothetical protein COB63_04495 [Candidatus Pelagibacter sp.]
MGHDAEARPRRTGDEGTSGCHFGRQPVAGGRVPAYATGVPGMVQQGPSRGPGDEAVYVLHAAPSGAPLGPALRPVHHRRLRTR